MIGPNFSLKYPFCTGKDHIKSGFHHFIMSLYNIFTVKTPNKASFKVYNFKVGNVMNHLSFKTGIDTYLSVLIIAMNAFLAVVAVGTLLALIGVI